MKNKITLLIITCLIFLTSCADRIDVKNCVIGEPDSFFHGGWYMFGFLLGVGAFTSGCSKINK